MERVDRLLDRRSSEPNLADGLPWTLTALWRQTKARIVGVGTTPAATLPLATVSWRAVNGGLRALLGRLCAMAVAPTFDSKIAVR